MIFMWVRIALSKGVKLPSLLKIVQFIPFFTLLVLIFWFTGCSNAPPKPNLTAKISEKNFDRSQYGSSPYGIWSELSELEQYALRKLPEAKAGDPDALLALYMTASGDLHTIQQFRQYRRRIEEFVYWVDRKMGDEKNIRRRAYLLHEHMHTRFFGSSTPDNPLGSYDFDSSQLSAIFESGKFNCISSALLYIVLCRIYDIPINGVILPSHAFVQIQVPDGSIIEVEVATKNGFDWEHDRDFFETGAFDWLWKRGLSPITYQDYLNRKIVQPWELGAYNMANQHVSPKRMAYPDRYRLAEIRDFLVPGNPSAQRNRLAFYNDEFNYLYKRDGWSLLGKMFTTIAPWINSIERGLSPDDPMYVYLCWIRYQQAYSLLNFGREKQSVDMLSHAMERVEKLPNHIEDKQVLQHNLYAILNQAVSRFAQYGKFLQAKNAYLSLGTDCLRDSICGANLPWLYGKWGEAHLEAKRWREAISVYSEILKMDFAGNQKSAFQNNLLVAYSNWAIENAQKGSLRNVREVWKDCLEKFPSNTSCQNELDKLSTP